MHELSNPYHPDILYFMEIKVNSRKAKVIIKNFGFHFPFFLEVSQIDFTVGLWSMKNSYHFQLQILEQKKRFVQGSISDKYNKYD